LELLRGPVQDGGQSGGQGSVGPPQQVECLALGASATDHLQPKIDGLAFCARACEPLDQHFDSKDDRAENADEQEGTKPGRIHASSFASGRNRSADSVMPWAMT